MKLRSILTLKYAGVTAVVFLVFVGTIYYVNEHSRSEAFYHNLRSEAVTKAHLFLDNRVDAPTMQSIYLNNSQFIDEVEVAVYTPDFRMLYHDALHSDIIKEIPEMIREIILKKEIDFRAGDYQGVGILYDFKGSTYVVTAAAYDRYGYANQVTMTRLLVFLLVGGLGILIVVGHLLAKSSLAPIRSIVREAEQITATEIGRRLPVKNKQDELGELSLAFNALLDRISTSFNAQKLFVSNVSHELRTPLSALSAELDLALQKDRTSEQYRRAIGNALEDSQRIGKLIDGLLNLAKADYQPEQIRTEPIRLDELLLDANELVLRAHPDYRIEPIFEQEADDDRVLTVVGNPYLLAMAFVNLIENNCKYSENKTSFIQISFWEEWTVIRFSDNGIGMSEADKENLFTLFYRGENRNCAQGYGIGMPLAQKIIALHKGDISVHSHRGEGTTYVVRLPHV